MNVLKITIELESPLGDALSDYLIGVHGAAVEIAVNEGGGPLIIQAFVDKESAGAEEIGSMVSQIDGYGRELADLFSCLPPLVKAEVVEDQDWAENWKKHFKPFAIVPGLVIAPTWEEYHAAEGERVIVMDPGMAFGTGHHESTRLCLELLRDSVPAVSGGTLLDIGTGTGILGMAALLFGAGRVTAVDNDPEAVRAAGENIRRNGLSSRMEIAGTDIKEIEAHFDIVVANIVHDVLLQLADELARLTRAGGALILSGLLEGVQSRNLQYCFEQKGFHLVEKRTAGPWSGLLLEKPVPANNETG